MQRFAEMVSTLANRKVFIDTSIAFAKQYNFSGLDLDWEFSASQEEMNNQATSSRSGMWPLLHAESKTSGEMKLLLTGPTSKFFLVPLAASNAWLQTQDNMAEGDLNG